MFSYIPYNHKVETPGGRGFWGRGSKQREQQVLRTDAKAEALILWPPDEKSRLTGKDPDGEKD